MQPLKFLQTVPSTPKPNPLIFQALQRELKPSKTPALDFESAGRRKGACPERSEGSRAGRARKIKGLRRCSRDPFLHLCPFCVHIPRRGSGRNALLEQLSSSHMVLHCSPSSSTLGLDCFYQIGALPPPSKILGTGERGD